MKKRLLLTNSGMTLVYKVYTFLVYCIPMGLLFAINHDEYASMDAGLTFGAFLLFGFVLLAFKSYVVSFFTKRFLLSFSLVLVIFCSLSQKLNDQMILITGVSALGAMLSAVVEGVANTYENMSYRLIDGVKMKNTAPAISQKEAWQQSFGFCTVTETTEEIKKDLEKNVKNA